jgi:Membrane protein involved in colicin uptake
MGKLTFLIIHCTATPAGRKVTSDDIRNWHIKGRGWKQVGYSDMIHEDGTVENLVPYNEDDVIEAWELTNGAVGMNGISRHIVYVGGLDANGEKPEDTRTDAQLEAMEHYIHQMIEKHPAILIGGHNQFAAKACPSFDTAKWLDEISIDPANIYLTAAQKKAKAEAEAKAKAKAEAKAKAKAEADAKAKQPKDKATQDAKAKDKVKDGKTQDKKPEDSGSEKPEDSGDGKTETPAPPADDTPKTE